MGCGYDRLAHRRDTAKKATDEKALILVTHDASVPASVVAVVNVAFAFVTASPNRLLGQSVQDVLLVALWHAADPGHEDQVSFIDVLRS